MINRIRRSVQPIALAGWLVFAVIALKWSWGCGTEWPWPVDPSGDTVTYEVVAVNGQPIEKRRFYAPEIISLSVASAKNGRSPWSGQVLLRSGEWPGARRDLIGTGGWFPIVNGGSEYSFKIEPRWMWVGEVDDPEWPSDISRISIIRIEEITFFKLNITRSEITGEFRDNTGDVVSWPTFRAVALHRGPR